MSAKYNLVCDQATTFNFQFVIKNDDTPWNLTGYTGVMTVKPFSNSTTTTLVASTANGSMVLGTSNGKVTVTFTATETNVSPSRYIYDLVLTSGSTVTRILEGKFIVTPGVTV
jgi:hypothetical protein